MKKSWNNNILKHFWIFLAILIFNYSIDIPDLNGDVITEDLSVNDIESVTELFLEVILGMENAVHEYEDDDGDEKSGFSKKTEIPFFQKIILEENLLFCSATFKHTFLIPAF
jgi:hypothetical protein